MNRRNLMLGTGATALAAAIPITAIAALKPPAAKAWVKFTGSTGEILSGYGISKVTRNAAGDYTIHFTTDLSKANNVGMVEWRPY